MGGQQHQHRLSEETRGRCEGLIIFDFAVTKNDPESCQIGSTRLQQLEPHSRSNKKVQPPPSKTQSRKVNNAAAVWRLLLSFLICECAACAILVTTGYRDCKHLHVVRALICWTSGGFVEHTERRERALHKRRAGCHRHRYLVHERRDE